MFKNLFGKDNDKDEVIETVDPVLEQRRKEKFSTPLIYSDEDTETKEETTKKVEPKKVTSIDVGYRMSEIISPIAGVTKTSEPEVRIHTQKKRKIKVKNDELVPVISPYYGPAEDSTEIEEEVEEFKVPEEPSVENNLRNIAHIVKEEQDQLKIIEERTGEFKLDLQNDDEDSFIDEIDDSMSLDELMSLYEKKFKD